MIPDNQELKTGDLVEILLPEITKGTTGKLMRACFRNSDDVVVAIDAAPRMQIRIKLSRYLVRKVDWERHDNGNNQECSNRASEIGSLNNLLASEFSQ